MTASETSAIAGLVVLVVVVLEIGLRVFALGVIPHNRKPSTAMAWLLAILLSPELGLLMFWLFGSTRLGRARRERNRRAVALVAERTREMPRPLESGDAPGFVRSVAHLNRKLGALPVVAGNRIDLEGDYTTSIITMAREVDTAEHEVWVEFYITAWDEVTAPLFEAMVRATERGVTVRLLFDHLGSRGIPGHKDMLRRLEATSIQWHLMLPISLRRRRFQRPDLRNHRKILVVDGRVAFMGSQNLTEPGYNKPKNHKLGREWVELMCRVEGPAVGALAAVFACDWYVETEEVLDVQPPSSVPAPDQPDLVMAQVVPSGPGFVAENNLRMFTTLIYGAQRRLSLTSPYFVPDESLLYAVTTAAQRGVDVELFVSELSDQFMVGHAQASYYQALLEAGVRIYLYPAPQILHAKHFTVDDEVAVIGSSNMDLRSFALNYEVSMMLLGPEIVADMRRVEDGYRSISRELSLEEWLQRPRRTRYVDNVMRLTAALQ